MYQYKSSTSVPYISDSGLSEASLFSLVGIIPSLHVIPSFHVLRRAKSGKPLQNGQKGVCFQCDVIGSFVSCKSRP